jgi:photosystem II stability/assembly factor-like uncharacterized protein
MVAGTEGWARTYRGLYWTTDGGGHWRNITPPIEHPARLGTVYFADPERGWAISEEGREGDNRDAIFSTADGGVTWTRTRIEVDRLGTNVAGASFAAAGPHLTYALVREARNTAYGVGYLFASRDGGPRWRQLPKPPPHAGEISFTDGRHGWLAGEGPHPAFYRTRDAGRSWTEVRLPRPPGLAEAQAGYLAPRFEANGHGVLAATYTNYGARAVAALYTTDDNGNHWKLAAYFGPGIPGISLLSYRGDDAAVGYDYPGPGLTLLAVGAAPEHLAGTGLPPESNPSLSFSGPEDGFAFESDEECEILIHCTLVNQLYFSADGGASWTATTRP